ncbi:unnamed protein product, partial [marine sediment metagenome]
VVPGLVERSFPRHIPEQPLLTELDREVLNDLAGRLGCAALPLQRRRPEEERYLFRIALGSALRAVVLTYSRLDEERQRPRMPSRFLGDACSALAGVTVRASTLEQGFPGEWFRRVPLDPWGRAGAEATSALDSREYDAAVFQGPGALRTGYMAAVSHCFARALKMEQGRWRTNRFGPYDGKIRAPDLLETLRDKYAPFRSAVSPTRFESYARCPFEYFLTYVLGVEEV